MSFPLHVNLQGSGLDQLEFTISTGASTASETHTY